LISTIRKVSTTVTVDFESHSKKQTTVYDSPNGIPLFIRTVKYRSSAMKPRGALEKGCVEDLYFNELILLVNYQQKKADAGQRGIVPSFPGYMDEKMYWSQEAGNYKKKKIFFLGSSTLFSNLCSVFIQFCVCIG